MSKSVLFVCMGNICRSPTGEGVLLAMIQRRGLETEVMVDSAGTINYHAGNRADSRMRAAATQRGYDLQSRARQVTTTDLDTFDLVVAMDTDNFRDLQAMASSPSAELRMLSDFLDAEQWPKDVPDPYYEGGFDFVLEMVEAACPAILAHLGFADAKD